MADSKSAVAYLVFDVEAIADGELISRVKYPGEGLSPQLATRRFRDETMAERADGKDILPTSFMLPVAVSVAKIDREFRLIEQKVIDEPLFRPSVITRGFWHGWKTYGCPALVSFNGRGYDLPVLELAAFRYGYDLRSWFNVEDKSYEQARNRYNITRHIDLHDLLTNFGAHKVTGGLNLVANLIGKPGKIGIDGSKVQDMHDEGRDDEINSYCRCDVLDTYFVFLRTRVLLGKITLDTERMLVQEAKTWLESKADEIPVYREYLDNWGEWHPPEMSGPGASV